MLLGAKEYAGWLADLVGYLGNGDWLPGVRTEYTSTEQLQQLETFPVREWTDGGFVTPWREFPLPTSKMAQGELPETKTVLLDGGVYVRLIETIAGFPGDSGYWPSLLEASAHIVALLATQVLSPAGFRSLQCKLVLVL